MNLEVLGVIEKYGVTLVSLVVVCYFLYKVVMFSLVRAVSDFKEEHKENRLVLGELAAKIDSMSDRHSDHVGDFKVLKDVIVDLVKEKK